MNPVGKERLFRLGQDGFGDPGISVADIGDDRTRAAIDIFFPRVVPHVHPVCLLDQGELLPGLVEEILGFKSSVMAYISLIFKRESTVLTPVPY